MRLSRESIDDLLNESELVIIKDEAFKQGVPVEDVLVVLGILLRNWADGRGIITQGGSI